MVSDNVTSSLKKVETHEQSEPESDPRITEQLSVVFRILAEAEFIPVDNLLDIVRPVSDIPRILQTWASMNGKYFEMDEVGMQGILEPIYPNRTTVTPEFIVELISADIFRPVIKEKVCARI